MYLAQQWTKAELLLKPVFNVYKILLDFKKVTGSYEHKRANIALTLP